MLAPLLESGDFWISLQKEVRKADEPILQATGLLDASGELGDFADTAALIAALDLVIAVDTSVAHLAGALGKPTWLMLPFAPDFRWLLKREDSPWYPNMRLFRQQRPGDWHGVIARVSAALGA
jgi:ADP-heptose:LPS heptosyltransferase